MYTSPWSLSFEICMCSILALAVQEAMRHGSSISLSLLVVVMWPVIIPRSRIGVQAGFVVCTVVARAVDCRRDRRGIGAALLSSIMQRCL